MELVKLKKNNKVITRTRFNYEKNLIHWKLRGFELVKDKPVEDKPKVANVEKPKKKKDK